MVKYTTLVACELCVTHQIVSAVQSSCSHPLLVTSEVQYEYLLPMEIVFMWLSGHVSYTTLAHNLQSSGLLQQRGEIRGPVWPGDRTGMHCSIQYKINTAFCTSCCNPAHRTHASGVLPLSCLCLCPISWYAPVQQHQR